MTGKTEVAHKIYLEVNLEDPKFCRGCPVLQLCIETETYDKYYCNEATGYITFDYTNHKRIRPKECIEKHDNKRV